MYQVTVFDNLFDTTTDKTFGYNEWSQFETVLKRLSEKRGYKGGKKSSPLISPAVYKPGTTRANANVEFWGKWIALDIDKYEGSYESLKKKILEMGYYFVIYSTASSTQEHPKFRLIFPLTEIVPAEKIRHFWYAMNKHFLEVSDPQTKDLSRMFYVPAQYKDAYNFFEVHPGNFLDPSRVMRLYHYVEKTASAFSQLSEEAQAKILEFRRGELTNYNITWTSYRDCPFVNQQLVGEYLGITGGGWYHKMYQIMVSIASKALRQKYPINAAEIVSLCKEIDRDNGNWYARRNFQVEAERALDYALTHMDKQ